MSRANRIFCAIDTPARDEAARLAAALEGHVGGIKLGLEFFTANGPEAVRRVAANRRLFLDLKLHDIPNTVAAGVSAVAPLRPAFLTIHSAGGPAMMRAAADAAKRAADQSGERMRLLGVTILTSMEDEDLDAVGQRGPVKEQVRRLAGLARASGLDGVICSPHEAAMLRGDCGPDFVLMVPGVRPAGSATQDQKRVMTPRQALHAGADYLVIGRPITQADDPVLAADGIAADL